MDKITAACPCIEADSHRQQLVQKKYLGMDDKFGEISIEQCEDCGRYWLHYFYENEGISRSGRFYCGIIPAEIVESVSPSNAIGILESLDWYFCGGSYYDGKIYKTSGQILNLF